MTLSVFYTGLSIFWIKWLHCLSWYLICNLFLLNEMSSWAEEHVHVLCEGDFCCQQAPFDNHVSTFTCTVMLQNVKVLWLVQYYTQVSFYLDCSVQRSTSKLVVILGIDNNLHHIMRVALKHLSTLPFLLPIPKFDQHIICR